MAGIEKQGSPNHKFQFMGVEKDKMSNFYETDFRRYDPQLGRLTGIDLMAEKLASISPYQYAFNNPIILNDPTGLAPNYIHEDGKYYKVKKNGKKKEVSWGKVHSSLKSNGDLLTIYSVDGDKQGNPEGIAKAFQHTIRQTARNDAIKNFVDSEIKAGRKPNGVKITSHGNITYPEYYKNNTINLESYIQDYRSYFAHWGDLAFIIGGDKITIRFYASRRNKDIVNVSEVDVFGSKSNKNEVGTFNGAGVPGTKNGPALVLRNYRREDIAFAIFNSSQSLKTWKEHIYNNYYKKYYTEIKKRYGQK